MSLTTTLSSLENAGIEVISDPLHQVWRLNKSVLEIGASMSCTRQLLESITDPRAIVRELDYQLLRNIHIAFLHPGGSNERIVVSPLAPPNESIVVMHPEMYREHIIHGGNRAYGVHFDAPPRRDTLKSRMEGLI